MKTFHFERKEENAMSKEQEDILGVFENMSPEWREAAAWIRKHINIVDWLAKGEEAPGDELEEIKRNAIEKKDYVLAAICMYKELIDKDNGALQK